MYALKLTEDQAKTLGYALTQAMRAEREKYYHAMSTDIKASRLDRWQRIEELRDILDQAPRGR